MRAIGLFASQHPIIFTLTGLVAAGIGYWVREVCIVGYAAIEIFMGVVSIYKSVPVNNGGGFDQPFGKLAFGGFTQIQYLTIMGAIYLTVRGLDNLNKGLKDYPEWKALRRWLYLDRGR